MLPKQKFPSDQPLGPEQLKTVWTNVSRDLRSTLGESTYDLWFAQSCLLQVDENKAVISSPGSMYSIWIEENFREVLKVHLDEYLMDLKGFSVKSCAKGTSDKGAQKAPKKLKKGEEIVLFVNEPNGDDSDLVNFTTPKRKKRVKRPLTAEEIHEKGIASGLNELYKFEYFVAGENSKLGHAAAWSAVNNPGTMHQPLFYYSASGLGKTHLLHAIGWEFLAKRPHATVLYVSAEKFGNEYIDAIRNNKEMAFRKKYRELDLLLIDDVQFLGGKSGFQREFFHTFNSIVDQHKQIVIASDCLASEISQLEERLVSRLQWGMTVQLHSPDSETAEAILRKKRDILKVNVSDEIITKVVDRVSRNVRQLEGALIRTGMVASLNDGAITEADLDELLVDMIDSRSGDRLDMEEIKSAVGNYFGIKVTDMEGKRRMAKITEARQVAMFFCRELTTNSLKEIAGSFGKDHASVIYAVKATKEKCEKSESLKHSIDLLRRRLTRGDLPKAAEEEIDVTSFGDLKDHINLDEG